MEWPRVGGRRSRFLQQQGGQEAPQEMLHPEARGCGGFTNHAAVVAGPQRLPSLRGQDNKGEALLSQCVPPRWPSPQSMFPSGDRSPQGPWEDTKPCVCSPCQAGAAGPCQHLGPEEQNPWSPPPLGLGGDSLGDTGTLRNPPAAAELCPVIS